MWFNLFCLGISVKNLNFQLVKGISMGSKNETSNSLIVHNIIACAYQL